MEDIIKELEEIGSALLTTNSIRGRQILDISKRLSLSSPIEPPATITPQMMSGVFAKSVSNTDTEHDHVYDHRIAAAEINKLLARPTSQASSEIWEVISAIIEKWPHESGICAPYYPSRCRRCQIAGALAHSRQGAPDNPDHYGLDRPRQGATK